MYVYIHICIHIYIYTYENMYFCSMIYHVLLDGVSWRFQDLEDDPLDESSRVEGFVTAFSWRPSSHENDHAHPEGGLVTVSPGVLLSCIARGLLTILAWEATLNGRPGNS